MDGLLQHRLRRRPRHPAHPRGAARAYDDRRRRRGVGRLYGAWLHRHGLEDRIAIHHSSPTGLLSAVRAGIGVAVLPSFIADRELDLRRCMPPMQPADRGLWLLTHERRRHVPRVRLVLDFLTERLSALARDRPRPPTADAGF
nr:LysR substrate-binding domain-containing protein [Sphingomonas profundi]